MLQVYVWLRVRVNRWGGGGEVQEAIWITLPPLSLLLLSFLLTVAHPPWNKSISLPRRPLPYGSKMTTIIFTTKIQSPRSPKLLHLLCTLYECIHFRSSWINRHQSSFIYILHCRAVRKARHMLWRDNWTRFNRIDFNWLIYIDNVFFMTFDFLGLITKTS